MREIIDSIDLYNTYNNKSKKFMLKQYDDTKLNIEILSRGKPFILDGIDISMNILRPDEKKIVQLNGISKNENIVMADVNIMAVNLEGTVSFEIIFTKEGKRISTYVFYGVVLPTLLADEQVSDEDADVIANALILSTKAPYIGENGNWYLYDDKTGQFVDSGKPSYDGAEGANDYGILANKPQINGVELIGNKTLDELGILSMTDKEMREALDSLINYK